MAKGDFGFNGKISAPGHGARRVRVVRLNFYLGIIASSDDEARDRRSFYSIVTTGSSFTMGVAFVSYEEREAFNTWFRRFMVAMADGSAKNAFMTIQCPVRKFYRTAVPESDLAYGEGLTDVGYVTEMTFIGASNPLDLTAGKRLAGVSTFKMPRNNRTTRYFYPAGRQVSGAESLDGTIYDPDRTSGGSYVVPDEVYENRQDDLPEP